MSERRWDERHMAQNLAVIDRLIESLNNYREHELIRADYRLATVIDDVVFMLGVNVKRAATGEDFEFAGGFEKFRETLRHHWEEEYDD